jgi:hypothetical protein
MSHQRENFYWRHLAYPTEKNMNNTPSVSQATDPAPSILALSHEEKVQTTVASSDLSPESLTQRASTPMFNRFLESDDKAPYLRHWGINE